ncbi:MAG: glucokinase [Rudaea sp.]|uniref:glucokinase n=1 Tax=unclassified Rudaea TaxID=2627037 RepID=UPI0010F7A16A|nr:MULTISPECIES: glucokinase [unclassified Rudaea]MBN8888050.1 glucokinase [Rudaea sp.]
MQGASPQFVDQPAQPAYAAPSARAPFLAADVGGTHARIGLVRPGPDSANGRDRLSILQYRKFACADYASLHDILREFTNTVGGPVAAHACIACAGLLRGDDLINANLPWRVSISRLRSELGLDRIVLVNDFKAVAYAAHFQGTAGSTPIAGRGAIDHTQPRLVVGPGTGLGAAVLIPGADLTRPGILATEGGHAALAARTELELEILRRLGNGSAHVPSEQIFSGPGMLALYRTLCALRAAHAQFESPAQITAAALAQSDALALETVELFCAWFGSLIGDLVMLLGAYGGVYLAGGVLPQIAPLLRDSGFAARLSDKGALREVLERVPVHLIDHGQLGVTGAAHWFLDHEYEEGKR